MSGFRNVTSASTKYTYPESNQSTVLSFKMFVSLIVVFIVLSLSSATDAESIASSQPDQEANYCLLPPYPENGRYIVKNNPSARPGESYTSVKLDISCDVGYKTKNIPKSLFCINGDWSATMTTCVSDLIDFCTLKDDPSVEYRCELSGQKSRKGSRQCESLVPSGTVVTPICRSPGYFSLRALDKMNCMDGVWDYNPICKPACGMITQHRQLEGSSSHHAELPWHVVIYMKRPDRHTGNFLQRCSGSLITATKIISATHCFWDDESKTISASDYLAAVGKLYRPYNDPRDKNSQQADVIDIKVSPRFKVLNFEDDIAIAFVETPFFFHLSVRPVCLDFDDDLDRTQLTKGNSGKIAGWSIANNNGKMSELLTVVDLPYLKYQDCYKNTPAAMKQYLVNDMFCAGPTLRNETSLCHGESGGGLVFLESTTKRYYLRGVLSFNINDKICDSFTSYTSILRHYDFIKQHL